MKTFYLIDGHAQFFRAYHAIRNPMTSPVTQEPTNATYGFVGVLLKLLRTQTPDFLAVAIDVSGDKETFRSGIYKEYKAHRPPPPEDLPRQIQRCISLLEEMSVPVIGVERYEADDVIATLAKRLLEESDEILVRIVSKDKDLQQLLVTGRVELYDPYNDELITADSLKADKGITPAEVIDMLALMGDNVDNVPGVPGIGPKTAAQLIAEYHTIDNLLANADSIKGKRGENIRAAAELLPLSRELIRLRDDVEFTFDLAKADVRSALHLDRLLPILRDLGFNRYQEDVKEMLGLDSTVAAPAARRPAPVDDEATLFGGSVDEEAARPAVDADYTACRTKADLDALVKKLRKAEMIAFDTETCGLGPITYDVCGFSFSTEPCTACYVPVRSPSMGEHLDEKSVVAALKPILEDPTIRKCGHNLKYDILVLRRLGIRLRGVAFDSMIASYLIDASRSSHSLNNLALAFLQHTCIPITDLIGAKRPGKTQKQFHEVALDRAVPYAAEDADIALRLCKLLQPQLERMGLMSLFDGLEMPLVDVLSELEWNGILCDPEELDRQAERLNQRIADLRAEIDCNAPYPFNPDSPKQLAAALFNSPDHHEFPGLGIKPLKRTKTGYSTDAEVLEKLAADDSIPSPIPRLCVEYRTLTKLVSTYLVALKEAINPQTKRIHASFNQTVAATGRLSSSDPNLQNIPIRTDVGREIRRAFVAPPGRVLISADYSQIELRLLAHLAKDANLTRAFRGGEDIHQSVAAEIHGVDLADVTKEQRSGAKMVNFGIVYGITPFGLARRLGIDKSAAADIIDGYKKRFPGITTFLQECIEQAREHGYVETIMKRRRPITEIDARNPSRRALAERMAINSVVQGSAADLIKKAMVDIHRALTGDDASAVPRALRDRRGEVLMLLQIHDELVFEAPKDLAEPAKGWIVSMMQDAMKIDVPLLVEAGIGENWFENK